MQEIIILGRGGQGAQTAGNLLAQTFFSQGYFVQTFATYGGARRGTPVSASLRIDDRPIRLRCNIESADAMLCFDDSLLDGNFLRFASSNALIVVNSTRPTEDFSEMGEYRIIPVDGVAIARDNHMGKVVNSALLGAFAATFAQPDIDTLCRVVEVSAPVKKENNVASCRQGYLQTHT
ncbi:MAG TPA: hypothetical protein ENI62_09815 [Gammaproteobacteria bacterium]|nr:hypothetical protein [Gammaproteobacteria bacterium]